MRLTFAFLAIAISSTGAAYAADELAPEASAWNRPTLLDGQGGPKEALREHGIIVDAWLTQFYQGVVAGDGDREWQYGGKGDLIATFDGGKLGLWKGLYVNVHQEWLYGEDANNQGDGSLFPINTALGFPRLGGYERDTSIIVTQAFNEQLSVSVGKFNMLDAASKTPLIGGGGLDTFMNTALAAPISGVTPPYIVGAIGTLKTEPAIFTLMVYDPRNAQDWDVVENPFEEGTTTSLSITVPTKIGGLSGYYGVRGVYSSLDGFNLANLPQLILPPGQAGPAEGSLTKDGYWYFSASVQQYLYQDPSNPAVGWGFFAEAAISDGNPNPVEGHFLAGLGGNSPILGRQSDRWGIAYFYYVLSDELIDGVGLAGLQLADEQGVEAFYNYFITPWLRLSGDIQWIDTGRDDRNDAVLTSVRLQTRF
jgi:porin